LNPLFPTSLLNYLYGLTAIRFRTCILWVAIGQAPGLFLYAYVGTLGQLGLNLLLGKSHPRTIEYVVWVGGLVISIVILSLLGRISLRLMQEAQERTANRGENSKREPPVEENCGLTSPPYGSWKRMERRKAATLLPEQSAE